MDEGQPAPPVITVPIELAGRRWVMCMNPTAAAEIDRCSDGGIVGVVLRMGRRDFRVSDIAAIITGGLKGAGEQVRYEWVGEAVIETGAVRLFWPAMLLLVAAAISVPLRSPGSGLMELVWDADDEGETIH